MSAQLKHGPEFDEVGYWSEVKLDIVKDYANAYTKAFINQPRLTKCYIDGFAGSGVHISKSTGEYISGSPLNSLNVKPPFDKHYFIDLDGDKVDHLRSQLDSEERQNVEIFSGDCNKILKESVFPKVQYEDFRRGLCLLDPYGLHLDWKVIEEAGQMGTIEIFLNFPIMDMNRNVLWHDHEKVDIHRESRMTAFWGDESWKDAAYKDELLPILDESDKKKRNNEDVARAFQTRLKNVAGFKYVPEPMPMRNSANAVIYYLFFASSNKTGNKIINDIFRAYRNRKN